jgi:hypothetical protein
MADKIRQSAGKTAETATTRQAEATAPKAARSGTLVEFFARSPLRGSGVKIERIRGGVRKVDLG